MMDKNQILAELGRRKDEFRERYSVARLGLFGSYAAGNPRPDSDIDILVEFDNETFDNYMDLKFCLEDAFNAKVDLVLSGTLKRRIRDTVLNGTLYA